VFHYAHFDIELFRLKQHLMPVGREDWPETPWSRGESIETWLQYLEYALRDVILEDDNAADLAPIERWAQKVNERDAVITFNYDTLVERAIAKTGRKWNHALPRDPQTGIPVHKLHGSIDWLVAHRSEELSQARSSLRRGEQHRSDGRTGRIEDDYRLWGRCRTREHCKSG